MSAQKGKDLLLKLDSDGAGTFATVAGMRSRSIAFNTETVDIRSHPLTMSLQTIIPPQASSQVSRPQCTSAMCD